MWAKPAGTKKHWPRPVPAPMQAMGAVLVLAAAYRVWKSRSQ
jgi:hypothetical protein